MDYATESALRQKVDNYEFSALRERLQRLENENRNLKEQIDYANGKLRNHYSAFEQIIQMMIDSEHFDNDINRLYEIKQYL